MKQHFRYCRNTGYYLLACITLIICYPAYTQTNAKAPVYVGYMYIKTEPGKSDTYDSLLRTYTKKVFDQEIKDGKYISWQVYDVLSPYGEESPYDIVGVAVTSNFDELLDPSGTNKEVFAKAFPEMNDAQIADVMKAFASSRKFIRREIYQEISSTSDDGPPTKTPAKYVQVDYMTPVAGKEQQYAKMESETFKPIHKQRMKLGALKGWVLLQKILPGDSQDPSPYVTVNFYDDFKGMMDGKYEQAIKAAYPASDANKMFASVGTVKKRQRIEVWKLKVTDSMQSATASK